MSTIILTGPKHSGKSSAGKALASIHHGTNNQIVWTYIDLDELITQQTGETPRQLYAKTPSIFQRAEAEAVSSILMTYPASTACPVSNSSNQKNNFLIIAAGGGIIDNAEALSVLKKFDAVIVYLNISADIAWSRIVGSTSTDGKQIKELPPFLQTENPQETHRDLHKRRAAAYRKNADIIIEAEGKTPDQIAAELLDTFSSIE